MKSKKIIISIIIVILILASLIGIYAFFFVRDNTSTLTMAEKNWIEANKNNVIDLDVINNYPVFNENGKGLLFDFISDMEDKTGLYFNEISYVYGKETTTDYSFKIVNEVDKNQITIYEDNYAVISANNIKYNKIEELKDVKLGVLEINEDNVVTYLNNANTTVYQDTSKLFDALENKEVDAIVLPKTVYLADIFKNNLYINYNISEMKETLVLQLGTNDKLNTIILKYFDKWDEENYDTTFGAYFTDFYFSKNNITEADKTKFQNKQYKYGFTSLPAFDKIINGRLYGINKDVLKTFAEIANIDVKYLSEYNNYSDLLEAFNTNKIDIYFNDSSIDKYELDVYNTVSIFNEEVVVLSKNNTNYVINSKQSLNKYEVAVIKNTKISKELSDLKVSTKGYNNLSSLLSKVDDQLIVVDKLTYMAYKDKYLSYYNEIYSFNLDENYTYTIRDISDNEVFINYYNFYLSFINELEVKNNIDFKIFTSYDSSNNLLYAIILFVLSLIGIIMMIKFKSKGKDKALKTISKDKKIKYIDMLTSLKNRNYLNDSIEKWDSSDIYPQSIVIVDLNNVAYINDNFGHEEGDVVIQEAANILIQNQMENSEIVRTSGNEFLVYLVKHQDKQVQTFTKAY